MIDIEFSSGTLLLTGAEDELDPVTHLCRFDDRVGCHRAEAMVYGELLRLLRACGAEVRDRARAYGTHALDLRDRFPPRNYQISAVNSWRETQHRGVIVLPTGTGKSYVARLAIAECRCPTLVVVPTIDLLQQWAGQLERAFGQKVGMLGGGAKDVQPLTVSTYDSAALMVEFIGNRFGLLVVDECHHLPSPTSQYIARFSIAPWRLGLTATPERDDGGEDTLYELLGPLCFEQHIDEMEGRVLAPYRTVRMELELDPDEREIYTENRRVYTEFVRAAGISFSSRTGWQQFLIACARRADGRRALDAYLTQKRVARAGRAKFRRIWSLLQKHAGDRVLVFTADNDTAYELGRRFLLPVLTHQTRVQERKAFLDAFREGVYPVLVTSRVLNEGIDVPEANVGIVVSGTGSTREHVQRLGRILRPGRGKQAVLYELVSGGTSESYVSERRRQHRAYQRPGQMSR